MSALWYSFGIRGSSSSPGFPEQNLNFRKVRKVPKLCAFLCSMLSCSNKRRQEVGLFLLRRNRDSLSCFVSSFFPFLSSRLGEFSGRFFVSLLCDYNLPVKVVLHKINVILEFLPFSKSFFFTTFVSLFSFDHWSVAQVSLSFQVGPIWLPRRFAL